MQTNLEIDEALLAEAIAATGLSSADTVEHCLRLVVERHRRQVAFDELAGIGWEGDLDAIREGRDPTPHL